MNEVEKVAREELFSWCETLLEMIDKDGALLCPSCNIVHGRSFDLVYPFMYLYSNTNDKKWRDAALSLFYWAEENVKQEDNSYINDLDSPWKGTTIFTLIQLLDTLIESGSLFEEKDKNYIEKRVHELAIFASNFDDLKSRNINYAISNSLALYLSYKYFKEDIFLVKEEEFKLNWINSISINGLIYGEGRPREEKTKNGVRPIDIGYNLEESIPAIIRLAKESNDEELFNLGVKIFENHLPFILSDGAIDNSFGTRSFKWTYYGSRTSDGLVAAALIVAERNPIFSQVALSNLKLQKEATYKGLLSGGLYYKNVDEEVCSHHSITHSKTLAYILSHKLYLNYQENNETLIRYKYKCPKYFEEVGLYIMSSDDLTLSITNNDWVYIKEGHPSGGSISLLHHNKIGLILSSSMNEYVRKEKNNMQMPQNTYSHETLTPRLEEDGYSSLYDFDSRLELEDNKLVSNGKLKTKDDKEGEAFTLSYSLDSNELDINVFSNKGSFILPLILYQDDKIEAYENLIVLRRKDYKIYLSGDNLTLPEKDFIIFNLIPGFSALKVIFNVKNKNYIKLRVEKDE